MPVRRASTRSTPLNFSTAGDNVIIAAPAQGPINIYGVSFTVDGPTTVTFKDGLFTLLSGPFRLTGQGSSMTFSINDEPWYFTQPGNGFVINQSQAVQLSGTIWYTTA